MSKLQMLRALLIERLATAAEEISALYERTTTEYQEELSRSKEESPRVLMNQGPRIKEEPEEHGVSQEEEQLSVPVPESSAVCVKREESTFEQLVETEADGDDDQVQSRDRRTKLSPNNKSGPETTDHNEDKLRPDGAEQKKHQCSVCNMRFRGRIALQTHIRVHTGEKPFCCSICQKTFAGKVNLQLHFRTHTGEKPFACLTCEARFAQHSNLKAHVRTHTGDRPYSCQTCENTFTQKVHLTVHRRTHTGEKPFACPTCEKAFAQASNLQRHMKTH